MAKGSKGRKPAPANETKKDKFIRLAKARVAKALKAMKQLKALTGSNYESDDKIRMKIMDQYITPAYESLNGAMKNPKADSVKSEEITL
jgi:hypothetical protein